MLVASSARSVQDRVTGRLLVDPFLSVFHEVGRDRTVGVDSQPSDQLAIVNVGPAGAFRRNLILVQEVVERTDVEGERLQQPVAARPTNRSFEKVALVVPAVEPQRPLDVGERLDLVQHVQRHLACALGINRRTRRNLPGFAVSDRYEHVLDDRIVERRHES